MIQKFNQFINEGINEQKQFSVHENINIPFSNFFDIIQERLDTFKYRINTLIHDLDIAIETTQEELNDIIVGEPIITVDDDLYKINVEFHTNIPNNEEAWNDIDSPASHLESKLIHLLDNRSEANATINEEPDEDGNCVISLYIYILTERNFGDYEKILSKLGEDYDK